MVCWIRFILYQGSNMCVCLIFLKSRPSVPALDIKTILTSSPFLLEELVLAFSSLLLLGLNFLSPDIITYLKCMSERDWQTYVKLFDSIVEFVRKPDLIIYLKASTDTLLSRIRKRNRNFEKNIDPEYIHSLNIYYNKWISKINDEKKLIINTDNFNVFKDFDRLEEIFNEIRLKLKKV